MQAFDKELKVSYDIDGELIQLCATTSGDNPFQFSILDMEKVNGATTFSFNTIEELEEVIRDFKETFAKIK